MVAAVAVACLLLVSQGFANAAPNKVPPGKLKKLDPPPPSDPAPTPTPSPTPTPPAACAGNQATTGRGTVVLMFDDGVRSQLDAASVLDARGYCATFYVVANFLRDGAYYTGFMSAAEVAALSAKGHDIESHTVTHPDLTTLTSSQLTYELSQSRAKLEAITGKPVRHIAYPLGASNLYVQTAAALHYTSGRMYQSSLADGPLTLTNPYALPSIGVERATSLDEAKAYVDHAIAHDVPVLMSFHGIKSSPDVYDWTLPQFQELVAYVEASGVKVRTIDQLSVQGGLPG